MSENTQSGKALIYMTARNCEMYAAASLASLARQTHDNLHVLYIDDASEDATGDIARRYLRELFPGKHSYIRNESQFGKARNVWEHLVPRAKDAEFIAVLDGDDQLVDFGILERMAQSYAAGRDVVWTNYITDSGAVGGNGPLNPNIPPRQQGWKTSHFFSFRASLLGNVPESYLKDSAGAWFPAACDIALAFPIIDQTREYEFIPVNAYRYTATNPYSHHNLDPTSQGLNSAVQQRCAQEILHKPPLPLVKGGRDAQAAAGSIETSSGAQLARFAEPSAVWGEKAADLLVVACPTLLDAQAVVGRSSLTPMQVWTLWQFISSGRSNRILHVGAASSAVFLAALTAAAQGVTLTCLTSSSEQAERLSAKLAVSGFSGVVEIVEATSASVTVGSVTAPFADTKALSSEAKFDLVIVDVREEEAEGNCASVSLPAIAPLLEPAGFRLGVLTRERASAEFAVDGWRRLSSGLKFCLDGIGGTGLVVVGG